MHVLVEDPGSSTSWMSPAAMHGQQATLKQVPGPPGAPMQEHKPLAHCADMGALLSSISCFSFSSFFDFFGGVFRPSFFEGALEDWFFWCLRPSFFDGALGDFLGGSSIFDGVLGERRCSTTLLQYSYVCATAAANGVRFSIPIAFPPPPSRN